MKTTTLQKIIPLPNRPNPLLSKTALMLSSAAIILSAFHFWPYENSRLTRMANPANLAVTIGTFLIILAAAGKYNRTKILNLLPHFSIFAYLLINLLSATFALSFARTLSFNAKLILLMLGAYLLFNLAAEDRYSLNFLFGAALAAAVIATTACLLSRHTLTLQRFGFHQSPFKYATYTAPLSALSVPYLLLQAKKCYRLLGLCLLIAGFASAGSIGFIAALTAAVLTTSLLTRNMHVAKKLILASLAGLLLMTLFNLNTKISPFTDFSLFERNKKNIRQRYIEWQAQINLLHKRTAVGTAAGCINDYRSKFYYRLPKTNTLKTFDQNGWLTVASETGIIGLLAFCWLFRHHYKIAAKNLKKYSASQPKTNRQKFHSHKIANLSAIIALAVANIFSSLQFNGVLIVFALVIALIKSTDRLSYEAQNA